MSEPIMFMFSLIDTGSVLFLLVYSIITLSDLECDYLNAQQCCSKLNVWVVPKLVAHSIVVLLFLLYGWWMLVLLNVPMILWMVYEYTSVPTWNIGVYDPTEIHSRGQIKKHMRNCMISLGWYLITFFIYLYCLITSLLVSNPLVRDQPEMDDF